MARTRAALLEHPMNGGLPAALAVALVLAGLSAWANDSTEEQIPEIVARVNGEPVMALELERLLRTPLARGELRQTTVGADQAAATRDRALRELIHRRLILQEAQRRKISVPEREIDRAVSSLRNRFEDLTTFGQWMHAQGLDERTLFDTLRANILVARATAAIAGNVEVSEQALHDYYETHAQDLRTEDVWIQIIVAQDAATVSKVQRALDEGEDFGVLAQRWSVGSRAARRGDVGWINSETLWPPVRQAVRKLEPGEAIGPVTRGEDEFLIIRLQERRPGRLKTFDEARPEVEGRLRAAEQVEIMQTWLTQQEEQAQVDVFLEK